MTSAHDETPGWGDAEGSPNGEAEPSSSMQQCEVPPGARHIRRIEMMCPHEDDDEEEELQQQPGGLAQQLQTVRESFEPPSPRIQTDLSGAVPRMPWADQPTDELSRPIEDMPDLEYRFYPANSRALPGANEEPTGLIQDATYRPADTFATTSRRGCQTSLTRIQPGWSTMTNSSSGSHNTSRRLISWMRW